ncbi:MAG TPA: hypothetical protein VFG99_12390 [Chloroflexia bacterium]|nr:hypothetical protein [Chloroflexia bacterium]
MRATTQGNPRPPAEEGYSLEGAANAVTFFLRPAMIHIEKDDRQ